VAEAGDKGAGTGGNERNSRSPPPAERFPDDNSEGAAAQDEEEEEVEETETETATGTGSWLVT
jgi:hypothetical protein